MPDYRRLRIPGASYFFTVNLLDRQSDLLVARIAELRGAVLSVRRKCPFHIDAWVVLPEHMHCLWTSRKAIAISRSVGRRSKLSLPRHCPRLSNARRL